MPDDLRERIAEMRLRHAVWEAGIPKWPIGHPWLQDGVYIANLAPALADAYDAAEATIAERDAEIARLREANARLTDAATNCALRATLSALSGATDG